MSEKVKKITVLSPCYNEELNVKECYERVKEQLEMLHETKGYDYEHLFIDNASKDNTVKILKELAAQDKHLKVICNARNAGWVRSMFYGLIQSYGDAVILIESDLQTRPSYIPVFVEKWEEGYKIVAGVKAHSTENPIMFGIRKVFYAMLNKMSDVEIIQNYLGVGLYDQSFIEQLREVDDPYPFFRGMVAELGTDIVTVPYNQEVRKRGKTSFNFFGMYDLAMLGFTSYTKIPLRLASFIGYIAAFVCLIIACVGLVQKIIYWDSFDFGLAAVQVGLFFLGSVQLIFWGVIGEYISAIYTQVRKRPLVIERERINFEKKDE